MQSEVTFIIPAYNAGKYLGATIRSVQNQTLDSWKMIIVDDGSADATREIAENHAREDSRIKVISIPEPSGSPFIPRLAGVRASDTALVAPLDADDLIPSGYLASLLEEMKMAEADVIFPTLYRMPGDNPSEAEMFIPDSDYICPQSKPGREFVADTLFGWKIGAGGGIIFKELFINSAEIIPDTSLITSDEILTRILLTRSRKTAISRTEYYYRENPESVTRNISLRTYDVLKTDIIVKRYISDNFPYDSVEVLRAALMQFSDLVTLVERWLAMSSAVSREERKRISALMKSSWREIDWHHISLYPGWKYRFIFRFGIVPAKIILRLISPFHRIP